MAITILSAEKDPMGAAISDYFNHHRADRLRVFSSQFEEDEIPVKELFRRIQSMPVLERTALQMATGRILDVGAGSGCHALALQEMGKDVCAIDISPLSVEVMKQRGVNDVRLTNLFDETFDETFDTILMLMNGSGIIGKLNNMPDFFQRMKRMLRPKGCILMDSSDLRYLFEEEDGSIFIDDNYPAHIFHPASYRSSRIGPSMSIPLRLGRSGPMASRSKPTQASNRSI